MFTLNKLHLTEGDRADAVSVYEAIDNLIWDAHRAGWDTDQGYEPCFEIYGTIELFAYLYCAAADLWRGLDGNMTKEEAICIAEDAFSQIYHFYAGYHRPRQN